MTTALYVASNIKALGSQVQLQRNVGDLSTTLDRLSTGLRINSAKDDPAGLIASESLKSDIVATKQAIQNTTRANNVLSVADSALGEVSSILTDIRARINSSANEIGTSSDELYANQLMIDASIDSIDRIAQTTVFKGQKILDGSLGFKTANVDNKAISNLQVNSASLSSGAAMDVQVNVLEAAKKATLIHKGGGVGEETTFDVSGSNGSYTFKFTGGADAATIAEAVNLQSEVTGVTASLQGEASHGNVVLSSTGANNDIVITAKDEGFDAGNYTFRVVQGAVNDAYIVSDPSGSSSGVVEISLQAAYTKSFSGVADALDITIASDSPSQATSVSFTRGTENSVSLATADTNASGKTSKGATLEVTNAGVDGHMSELNGWTFTKVSDGDSRANTFDDNAKIAFVTSNSDEMTLAIARITGATVDHDGTGTSAGDDGHTLAQEAASTGITFTTSGSWTVGESLTLGGGAEKGELQITYKEGATAGQIASMLNTLDGVQASVASGVSNDTLIANVPGGASRLTGYTSSQSSTTSQASATEVVALINDKLGSMFDAALMTGDSGSGKVTFQDASAIYGSVASDNAIQFSGQDDGPVIRLVTGGSNKELGVTLRNPTEEDIKNGITTQVLEVQLATNASGNSKTTAADIVNLFNTLSAEQTGGVSASLVLPAGIDPNGRTWATTSSGCSTTDSFTGTCAGTYGTGICGPTGEPGTCSVQENDICLLGANEKIVDTNAIAYVANSAPTTIKTVNQAAVTSATADKIGEGITPDNASGVTQTPVDLYIGGSTNPTLNGLTIKLVDSDTAGAHWNADTQTVEVNVDFTDITSTLADLKTALTGVTVAGSEAYFGQAIILTGLDFTDATGKVLAGAAEGNGAAGDYANDMTLANAGITAETTFTIGSGIAGEPASYTTGLVSGPTGNGYDTAGELLSVTADATNGQTSLFNGVTLNFVKDTSQAAGAATVTGFDEKTGILTIGFNGDNNGQITAATLIGAVNTYVGGTNTANVASIARFNGSSQSAVLTTPLAMTSTESAANLTAANLDGVSIKLSGGSQVGDVVGSQASTGSMFFGTLDPASAVANNRITINTTESTAALNGVAFNFTDDASKAGFDGSTGTLTVFLHEEVRDLELADSEAELKAALDQAVNGAINGQWEQIRSYTKSTEGPATVSVTITQGTGADATAITGQTLVDDIGKDNTTIRMPSNDGTSPFAGASRGVTVNDPALLIEANSVGTNQAGIKFQFVQDGNLAASTTESATIRTSYDEEKGVFTIYANASETLQSGTDGGINAEVLAKALNDDTTFNKLFTATAPMWQSDPNALKTEAVVAFSPSSVASTTTMVGGTAIATGSGGGTNSSTGISMRNNSDENLQIVFQATEAGSNNFVSINVTNGTFNTECPQGTSMSYLAGTDAVVNVAGQKATALGNSISTTSGPVQVQFELSENMDAGDSTTFTIQGGGAVIQMGPDVVASQQLRIGIPSVNSMSIGGKSGVLADLRSDGKASILTDTKLADKIIKESINSVTQTRARIGVAQGVTLAANQVVLEDTLEQLTSAEASYSNADFAEESVRLTQAQILISSASQALALSAQFPQYAAQLIR